MKKLYPFLFFFLGWATLGQAQSDQIKAKKGNITVHPVLHAAMVLQWNGKTIYVDPYGGAARYKAYPAPNLVLITDIHGDHLHKKTLDALDLSKATLVVPKAVKAKMGELKAQQVATLANGKKMKTMGIKIKAIPMYNLPETAKTRHPKGRGNGYVLTMGGKRLYISGDTEDIKEMRALKGIDVAFVCMNLPYTMTVDSAASAVLDFKPDIVYPFHFRGKGGFSDVNKFKQIVNKGNPNIEVRLRDWYKK
ncbi:MBL fold metallo-hydrolase [Microscilla marina]|uniref:Putative metal-dependent hydrolase n=1 Tax=Microscilla marina ATCC 23134 TaxID=313606 RepID=A1ZXE9_MICM2|nr:MBL fold metallo-hydrolase [Microscilla marina]EAY24917.1 putative metal-dependent hydrolase [Microscilla marina ATCC 23134]